MKDLLKQQRELCFEAFIKGKGAKYPKNLYNYHYDLIINAKVPEYREKSGAIGIAVGAISGALITALTFWMFVI